MGARPRTIERVQEDQPAHGSLTLLKQVTAHMREAGVRRVRMVRGPLELEVELDPASQYLGKDDAEQPDAEEAEKVLEEKRAKGLCISAGCERPGGHMGQPHCRQHFLAEMNGAQTT